ncbi:PepSY-associated TM helix domain-containing protein [Scytonema sp. NUACC26]|uniref:PepSY-associated TM helix domain-containing protein n=1 Tax=Scytonema sp. NUACC26 TaxID=3140176 RepID=UPI0034DC6997
MLLITPARSEKVRVLDVKPGHRITDKGESDRQLFRQLTLAQPSAPTKKIQQLSEIERPFRSAQKLVQSPTPSPQAAPEVLEVTQVSPQGDLIAMQQVVDIAQKRYPDLKPHRITIPEQPERVYTVMMTSSKDEYTDVYINPYNGEVTGSRPWKQSLYGWLIEAHVHLFAGDIGMQVVGVCGGILLLLGVTGLILWNGWRSLKHGFKIRWNSPKQLVNYDLHKVGGIVSVVLLSLIAFTGTMMVFWTPVETALYQITNTQPAPEPKSTVVAGVAPMEIDALLEKAQATLPNAKFFKIFPAKKPEDAFRIWMEFPQ